MSKSTPLFGSSFFSPPAITLLAFLPLSGSLLLSLDQSVASTQFKDQRSSVSASPCVLFPVFFQNVFPLFLRRLESPCPRLFYFISHNPAKHSPTVIFYVNKYGLNLFVFFVSPFFPFSLENLALICLERPFILLLRAPSMCAATV